MPSEPRRRGFPGGFGEGRTERAAVLVLSSIPGIRPLSIHDLAWREGTASACLARLREGTFGTAADRAAALQRDPAAIEEALTAAGARLILPGEPEYPEALLDLDDPPLILFARGRRIDRGLLRVAVVGSRSASTLGKEVATSIGRGLASAGVCVVSGAARGIDAASHRGALAAGSTIAVMGSGIDVAYPASSRGLIERIAHEGTVVSEYPPGVPPRPHLFPARNRIVVGLSRALVVVEGARASGSMISVAHALSIGRDVFAVPGPVASPLSEAPLTLIREGARMIRDAEDLLEDLGIEATSRAESSVVLLPEADRLVLDALPGPSLPEVVAERAGIGMTEAVASLMRLELRGLVRSLGGRFEPTLASRGRAKAPP
jgi:DNA processing protein